MARKSKSDDAVQVPVEQALPEEVQDTQEDPVSSEGTITVNSPTGLNLREGPGESFDVLEVLPNGAQLTVLQLPGGAEVPSFALVRYAGSECDEDMPLVGWVNTDFVRED